MKKLLIVYILCIYSCVDKTLELPVSSNNDITTIVDVSPIYVFYNDHKKAAVLNRNNMISSTNWLVNIDKRLTLKQLFPHLKFLQEKRHSTGMHSNKNAKNYFTCFNEHTNNLSFIEFTKTIYHQPIPTSDISNKINLNKFDKVILATIFSKDSVNISHLSDKDGISSNVILNQIAESITTGVTENEKIKLYTSYNQNLSFQDYINVRSELLTWTNGNVELAFEEFINN